VQADERGASGEAVEIFSQSAGQWMRGEITHVDADGRLTVDYADRSKVVDPAMHSRDGLALVFRRLEDPARRKAPQRKATVRATPRTPAALWLVCKGGLSECTPSRPGQMKNIMMVGLESEKDEIATDAYLKAWGVTSEVRDMVAAFLDTAKDKDKIVHPHHTTPPALLQATPVYDALEYFEGSFMDTATVLGRNVS
jgi:hypothetical protein